MQVTHFFALLLLLLDWEKMTTVKKSTSIDQGYPWTSPKDG
jgi:hypothetical protein